MPSTGEVQLSWDDASAGGIACGRSAGEKGVGADGPVGVGAGWMAMTVTRGLASVGGVVGVTDIGLGTDEAGPHDASAMASTPKTTCREGWDGEQGCLSMSEPPS